MDAVNHTSAGAFILLDRARKCLTPQQYKTLRGQILAGNAEGALRGLDRIMERRQRRDTATRQGPGNSDRQ